MKAAKEAHSSTTYVVNGRTYRSLEEMPPEVRKLVEDKNKNGIPDIMEKEGVIQKVNRTYVKTVTLSGKEDINKVLEDKDGNGIPDIMEESNAEDGNVQGYRTSRAPHPLKKEETSLTIQKIITIALLILLVLSVLYMLYSRGWLQ